MTYLILRESPSSSSLIHRHRSLRYRITCFLFFFSFSPFLTPSSRPSFLPPAISNVPTNYGAWKQKQKKVAGDLAEFDVTMVRNKETRVPARVDSKSALFGPDWKLGGGGVGVANPRGRVGGLPYDMRGVVCVMMIGVCCVLGWGLVDGVGGLMFHCCEDWRCSVGNCVTLR